MSDQNNYDYGFCPRCGAVMQNGICQSCGYGRRPGITVREVTVSPETKKKKASGKHTALWVGLLIIFVLVVVLGFLFFSIRGALRRGSRIPEAGYGYDSDNRFGYGDPYDDYYNYYDDSYSDYTPSPSDDYYVEITDAVADDLSYRILWKSVSVTADSYDDECSYYAVYPVLFNEDDENKFEHANKIIEEMACKYQDVYREYEFGTSSYGYVTYMDEEKISIVFQRTLYQSDVSVPLLDAVTIHADTGEVMPYSEMVEVNQQLLLQFRSRDSYQNGTVEFVAELSDEELEKYLSDDEKRILFYTPVGLEIGFNYDGGWVTVTLKDIVV